MSTPPIHLESRASNGARKFSPSAARNRVAIGSVLSEILPADARVLEIASGTGEHALHMRQIRPDLSWQTSDPDAASRASQNAWLATRGEERVSATGKDKHGEERVSATGKDKHGEERVSATGKDKHGEERVSATGKDKHGAALPALSLDVMAEDWTNGLEGLKKSGKMDAVFCANMIHIAPWQAAQGLVRGAAKLLPASGLCILYGPFQEGALTAPSNLEFDANLRARNPEWGVRNLDDVKHIFALHGFNLCQRTELPKNNLILVFKRS